VKIIYHCYGGAHSSVTAAFIHLGLLPAGHIPGGDVFRRTPFFDRQDDDEHGHFFFMGSDETGHQVYLTARRGRPDVLEGIFQDMAAIFDIPAEDYLLVDVTSNVNLTMKLGGYISRRWGAVRIGRPIVILGTRAAYSRLVDLVRKVKGITGGFR